MTSTLGADTPLTGRLLTLARATWLVITLFTLSLYVAGLPFYWQELTTPCQQSEQVCIEKGIPSPEMREDLLRNGLSIGSWAAIQLLINLVSAGVWFTAGAIIFFRKSDYGMALFIALFLVMFGLGVISSSPLEALALAVPVFWLPVQTIAFIGSVCVALFAYLFPDGRFVPRWTRWFALAWVLMSVSVYFFPGSPLDYETAPELVNIAVFSVLVVSFFVAQLIRYRQVSDPTQRQQTKWIVFGISAAVLGSLTPILILTFNPALERQVVLNLIATVIIYGSMLLIPISFGIAILRSRLWDIDLLINRTLVYVPLTAILAGIFAATISLSQKFFIELTGQSSDAATVLTTLIVVAMFDPLKKRLQENVDKRFKTARDPATQLSPFTDMVNTRIFAIDSMALARRLLDESVKAFDAVDGAVYVKRAGELQLVKRVGDHAGEDRLTIPLETSNRQLGLLSLGARRNGSDYTAADVATLQRLAESVASAIATEQMP